MLKDAAQLVFAAREANKDVFVWPKEPWTLEYIHEEVTEWARHVLRDIACGRFEHVSWDTLLLVRMRLGMPDLPPIHTVDGCPTCGGVHIAGDCHNRPVASVVTLAPGEVVAHAADVVKRTQDVVKRERKPRATVQMEPETRELLRSDKRPGESFDDVIRRWHDSALVMSRAT